jgi:hypothetical protein
LNVGTRKNRRTRADRRVRTNTVNGKVAKRLRRLARELKLDPETKYAPFGELQHLPERVYVDRASGETRTLPAGVLRRPFAMIACERRAYQEAKAIYRGDK